MKQVFIFFFFFVASGSFAQNSSVVSDKRVLLPPLAVESTDAGKQDVIPSDAVPLTGQKYESSQKHTLMLVPVGNASGNMTNTGETLMMSETATPLPASASTTSQSNNLTLIPANTQKP